MQQIRGSVIASAKDHLFQLRTRRSLFELAWRVAILVLPWQTRWFNTQDLAGWPWEQGRWSIYLVWLPMSAAIYFGWGIGERKIEKKTKVYLAATLAALGVITVLGVTGDMGLDVIRLKAVAATQWWVQGAVLGCFFFSLWSAKISRKKVLGWFVVSLLPVVVLSYIQFVMQQVLGAKWLGIANHDPRELGVSVVEFGEFRLLRIYGSMPHPNILGGWLASGIVAAAILAYGSERKNVALFWSVASALNAGVLILTFSRSAFLAAAIGMIFSVVLFFIRRKDSTSAFQFGMLALCTAGLVAGVVAYAQREPIMVRVQDQSRLEVKSLSQRGASLEEGFSILKRHPFFGSGANAEQVETAMRSAEERDKGLLEIKLREPIESPHNSFLLLLVDFGILGSLVLFGLVAFLFYRKTDFIFFPFLGVMASVLWFDHYGVSYWSGMSLVALAFYLATGKSSDQTLQV